MERFVDQVAGKREVRSPTGMTSCISSACAEPFPKRSREICDRPRRRWHTRTAFSTPPAGKHGLRQARRCHLPDVYSSRRPRR
jgi:hypothetical protein